MASAPLSQPLLLLASLADLRRVVLGPASSDPPPCAAPLELPDAEPLADARVLLLGGSASFLPASPPALDAPFPEIPDALPFADWGPAALFLEREFLVEGFPPFDFDFPPAFSLDPQNSLLESSSLVAGHDGSFKQINFNLMNKIF